MPRGYRGVIAAAGLACLLIVFGVGLYVGTLNYPNEERHQEYRYTDKDIADAQISARPDMPKSKKYKAPCEKPYGKDESDLCAQWRAAKAAENSAFWAKWGFWIAIVGAVGIVAALLLTIDSNRIARDTARRQLRAYMVVDTVTGDIGSDGITARLRWINCGQTPAFDVSGDVKLHISTEPNFDDISIRNQAKTTVGAGKGFSISDALPYSEFENKSGDTEEIWFCARLVYNDVFGIEHKTEGCFSYAGGKSFVAGPAHNIAT